MIAERGVRARASFSICNPNHPTGHHPRPRNDSSGAEDTSPKARPADRRGITSTFPTSQLQWDMERGRRRRHRAAHLFQALRPWRDALAVCGRTPELWAKLQTTHERNAHPRAAAANAAEATRRVPERKKINTDIRGRPRHAGGPSRGDSYTKVARATASC